MEEISLPSASQEEFKSALIGHTQFVSCIDNAWGKNLQKTFERAQSHFALVTGLYSHI